MYNWNVILTLEMSGTPTFCFYVRMMYSGNSLRRTHVILGWKAETESVSKPSEKSNTIRS
ncbi:hypothetical protein LEP1GSC005_2615 [Leptospira santarosai str. ST188]|nr:hypothetical protein LEP1GSC005_2615 [Leptospira santarosai str. ST188]